MFAVACAESFLVEWVRDEILKHDYASLNFYFPPGNYRSIEVKWKEVPKQLKEHGRISSAPNLAGSAWADFLDLIEFRNGLLHGRSSRPETSVFPNRAVPFLDGQATQSLAWMGVRGSTSAYRRAKHGGRNQAARLAYQRVTRWLQSNPALEPTNAATGPVAAIRRGRSNPSTAAQKRLSNGLPLRL